MLVNGCNDLTNFRTTLRYSKFHMTRRTFLSSIAAAAVAQTVPARPNIVFILLDDLGYGDFGCYGQTKIKTPHADRLAAEGMRFTNCYAGGTVCAPSRSVLMSGLHNGHAAIRANAGTAPIEASDVTLIERLRDAGYRTGGFGKWGLGDKGTSGDPMKHGFNEFVGYYHQIHAHSYFPEFLWDSGKRWDLPGNVDGKKQQYSADLIAERSYQFLSKSKGVPFFLYATYTLPHAEFEIPSDAPYSNEPWSQGAKTYAAMVTRADSYIGRIVHLLDELQLARNTVVFVASDNGGPGGADKGFELFHSNGILRGEKGGFYEGGIRVPMIVRWPGHVKAGSTSALPWTFADVLPTLLEIVGAPAVAAIDGLSVLPTLIGKGKQSKHEYLYWEIHNWNQKEGGLRKGSMKQAARAGDFKAIRNREGAPVELYDLAKDPSETKDLAAEMPEVVRRMERILKEAHAEPRSHAGGTSNWVQR